MKRVDARGYPVLLVRRGDAGPRDRARCARTRAARSTRARWTVTWSHVRGTARGSACWTEGSSPVRRHILSPPFVPASSTAACASRRRSRLRRPGCCWTARLPDDVRDTRRRRRRAPLGAVAPPKRRTARACATRSATTSSTTGTRRATSTPPKRCTASSSTRACATRPARSRIEFRWEDATLVVVDGADRLRRWPFSADDKRPEATHHAYALISALSGRIHLTRDAGGGTRASVMLPVMRARYIPVIRADC